MWYPFIVFLCLEWTCSAMSDGCGLHPDQNTETKHYCPNEAVFLHIFTQIYDNPQFFL